jgi:GAF domain-containing protein
MHVLADLIAVAIENARLFEEGQYALEATRRAYGEISKQAWRERLEGKSEIAYRSQKRSTFRLQALDAQQKIDTMSPQQISIPIKIRDSVIGYVDTYKSLDRGFWTEEEQETLNAIVEQIGIALESARLYESSLMQAERERLVGDINTHFQQSLDVNAVVQTAAQEIQQALELENIRIVFDDDFAGSMDILEVNLYE